MATVSGKDGKVLNGSIQIAEITKWTFNPTANVGSWHSSSGDGSKARVAGTKSGSGDIEGKIDEDSSLYDDMQEGSTVQLYLYRDGSDYFEFDAVITGIDFEVDIDDGEVNSFTASYETNGEWSDN